MSTTSDKKNTSNKKKYIPISEIDRALIPGRREKCDCEASVHDLISNCLNCGRIVCESENVGPCFTCGQNVISKKELDELARINKEIADLEAKEKDKNKQKQQVSKTLKDIAQSLIGIEQATEHKDKLLEYERTSEKRTKVIDDENDYFDLTRENWLSNEKREGDKVEKLHEDRFDIDRRYELDFATRQVVEVQIPKIQDLNEEVSKLKEETVFKSDYEIVDFKDIANEPDLIPYYIDNNLSNKSDEHKNKNKLNKNQKSKSLSNKSSTLLPNMNLIHKRLQNSELFNLADDGYALSINQPFASLLIHGIKQHEGRTWFTQHRGPLWIHASAKSPRKEEIAEAENLFKLILNDNVKFPSNYPLGCLIGRANLIECLAQEEYQTKFNNAGLIEDPFVFIFNDFIKLNVDIPCSGKQKIFKLDKNIFKVASSQIQNTYSRK